jgi:hypothetical protein
LVVLHFGRRGFLQLQMAMKSRCLLVVVRRREEVFARLFGSAAADNRMDLWRMRMLSRFCRTFIDAIMSSGPRPHISGPLRLRCALPLSRAILMVTERTALFLIIKVELLV